MVGTEEEWLLWCGDLERLWRVYVKGHVCCWRQRTVNENIKKMKKKMKKKKKMKTTKTISKPLQNSE